LVSLRDLLEDLAGELERLTDAMLLGRRPAAMADRRTELAAAPADDDLAAAGGSAGEPSPAALARGLTNRVLHINDETLRLVALARGDAEPDFAVVRAAWQMFVSPTTWSWGPLTAVWRWNAPTLRHAIRASLAIGCAYALSFALPWHAHDYWILLTIVVVLRGSLAQTLERRNSRVLGTLLGCLLAAALLWGHLPPLVLLLFVSVAQALAHAFAIRKYLVTAIAATVLGLVQAHLLNAGTSPAFDVVERMADTLIGVAIAWIFSYVLPSWERSQLPGLVARTLSAQARHARVALGLGQLKAVDNEPELAWRLERREAYDSLSALVQATQRSLSEPRAVRPPLVPLGRLLAHSYQLLAQLTAVKTMLLLRRGQLDAEHLREPLRNATETIELTLLARPAVTATGRPSVPAWQGRALAEPAANDLTPWALRRLDLAESVAVQLRQDADEVISALAPPAA
ncbi:MAG TPA: FUSC family protein, partial [Ramlibacter sp.]|nr:FUSC family protein [Ramlibacter sp.]